MQTEIFRKKSIEKIKSPENLDEYIHVSKPSVWILIAAAVVLLIGLCIWGIFGQLISSFPTFASVVDGRITCILSSDELGARYGSMSIKAENVEHTVTEIAIKDFSDITLSADTLLPDGQYPAEVIVEKINPIHFLLD